MYVTYEPAPASTSTGTRTTLEAARGEELGGVIEATRLELDIVERERRVAARREQRGAGAESPTAIV